ncbi:conserved hypothetical protein [Gammaproteobacteria bacterium]
MAKPKIKPRFTPATLDQLLAQAADHQEAQRYKELIDVYKELLQREVRPEWQVALSHAYGQRAQALAAKGMYREAVAMWESSRISGDTNLNLATVAGWMLAAGMYTRVATLLREIPTLPENLQIHLGAVLLMGNNEFASSLPEDAPLIRHLGPARIALEAWCLGNDTVVREQLRAIPFRSPYRELRQILQGLLTADKNPLEAIPANSPYINFAQVAIAAQAPLANLEKRIATLRPAEQELAAILRGVDPTQLRLVLEVRAALTNASENLKPLFSWVTTRPAPVSEDQARRFALAILPHQPHLLAPFQKRFGVLPPFEIARLQALLAEQEDNPKKAQIHWKNAFKARNHNDSTGTLMGALILRHLATLETQMYGPDDPDVIKYLSNSLELDPLDRATWLKIINIQRDDSDKKWHSVAERALIHLPEDSELLLLAAQGAAERGAYKKASGYVNTLLHLDPINNGARHLLISLHLSHARKSLKGNKLAIATKELETAQRLAHGNADNARIAVHRAFLALTQENLSLANEFAIQAANGPAGGMGAALLLRVEGKQANINPDLLSNLYKNLPESTPETSQVIALLELTEELLPLHNERVIFSFFNGTLAVPLRAAASHSYTEDQLTRLFEILYSSFLWGVVAAYAEAALERWPEHPFFVLHKYIGHTQGQRHRLSKENRDHLTTIRDAAVKEKNIRTAQSIDDFLGIFPMPHRGNFPDSRWSGQQVLDSMPPEHTQEIEQLMNDMAEGLGRTPEQMRNALSDLIGSMMDEETKHEIGEPRRGRGRNR